MKRWRDADRSDHSSSRAAIDCSSWQGRPYENAKQSDLFTAAIITHRDHTQTYTNTAGGGLHTGKVCNQTHIQRNYKQTKCKLTVGDIELQTHKL